MGLHNSETTQLVEQSSQKLRRYDAEPKFGSFRPSRKSIHPAIDYLPNSITKILLGGNDIQDVFSPKDLSFLGNLQEVDFSNNPFIYMLTDQGIDYRSLIYAIVSLDITYLNFSPVREVEVNKAQKIFQDSNGKFSKKLFNDLLEGYREGDTEGVMAFFRENCEAKTPRKSPGNTPERKRSPDRGRQLSSHDRLRDDSPRYNATSGSGGAPGGDNSMREGILKRSAGRDGFDSQRSLSRDREEGNMDPMYAQRDFGQKHSSTRRIVDNTVPTAKGSNRSMGSLNTSVNHNMSPQPQWNRERPIRRERDLRSSSPVGVSHHEYAADMSNFRSSLEDTNQKVEGVTDKVRELWEHHMETERLQRNKDTLFRFFDPLEFEQYYMKKEDIHVSTMQRSNLSALYPGVIKMQTLIRAYLVRKRYYRYKFQHFCITKIQAAMRGHLVRKNPRIKKLLKNRFRHGARNEYYEREIDRLQKYVSLLEVQVEELTKTKNQHEKALRYLFEQVNSMRQASTPRK
eukprot:CAMPEP_0115037552 /NCGR_PEP_ID=MMETSP0216-20121206/42869_1 /TAXON_ID=223996 /ORGANISM="Protocruzia adherens, Strain Boccale" /LENGTH=513 /DNA_ID=CAMNT_0002417759 /DNA_START=506 /DNA_END=2047 /DNA_ORIENTATION=+